MYLLFLGLLFAASSAVAGSNESHPLTLSVLLPLSFASLDGDGYLPAMDISLELINNKTDLLPGYTLNAVVNDSACDASSGVRSFIDVIFKEPVKVAMIGPICSSATGPVAELAHFWNLVLISAGATNPSLSNTAVYPTFLRSVSPETAAVDGIIALMKKYGWTRVAAITSQQDSFQAAYSDLSQAVLANNFEEARNFAFGELENPRATVNSLYNSPFRIIFVNMYPAKAIEIICQALSLGMTRSNGYVWIFYHWYGAMWWATEPEPGDLPPYTPFNCSIKERASIIDGAMSIDHFTIIEDEMKNNVTDIGLSYNQFFELYYERARSHYSYIPEKTINTTVQFIPHFVDALWTIALALNTTDNGRTVLQNFTYDSVNLRNLIYNNSVHARFSSLSGQVSYKPNGDRRPYIRYFQYRPSGRSLVSIFIGKLTDNTGSGALILQPGETDDTLFIDGIVPVDKTLDYVDTWLFSSYVVLGTAGLVYASIWLMINIIYRNKKVIKLSSPYLNIVIITGAMLFYLDIILFGMDEALIPTSILNVLCMARVWIVVIAFSLLFGTLFAKTWRVYYIFHSSFHQRKTSKWVIKDGFLFLMIGVLLVIDCVFMISFTAIPGTRLELTTVTVPSTDHSLPVQLSICSSDHQLPALSALLVYKGILLIIGLFLAFETRNIKIKELNDSPLIAMCIYTTVVLSISLSPIGILLTNYVDIHYGLIGSLTMLGVTIILSTLFVPQAYRLVKDPTGSRIFTKNSPQSAIGGSSMPRPDINKDTIEYHMSEIDRLKKVRKQSDSSVSSMPGFNNKNNSCGQNVPILSPVDENEVVQVVVGPNDEVSFSKPSPPLSSSYFNDNGHY